MSACDVVVIGAGFAGLVADLAGLQRPAGAVHFASSDNASLWGGFVDGAIESGLREARRVAAGGLGSRRGGR